jgi:hypothetical protein
LTPDQNDQVDALEKDVRAKLHDILTSEQRDRLESMRRRGPDGPPGGPPEDRPGGRRPPGGGPPRGSDDDRGPGDRDRDE